MSIVLLSTDLMATSSARGAADAAGVPLSVATASQHASAVDGDTRLVLLDLASPIEDLPGVVAAVRASAPAAAVVAYGPHVHEARLAAARQAGCDRVLARGQFYRQMSDLFASYAAGDR